MMREPKPQALPLDEAKAQFESGSVVTVDRTSTLHMLRAGKRLVTEVEGQAALIDSLGKQLANAFERAANRDIPRTITLSYMPRDYSSLEPGNRYADTGGHWTVSEAGRHQTALDPRETLALVAAMLLGAKHPPLESSMEAEHRGREWSKRMAGEPSVQDTPSTVGDAGERES